MPKTKSEKRRVKEPTAPGGGQVRSRGTGHGTRGTQGQPGAKSGSDLANLEKLAGASTPDQRGRGGLRRSSRLSRARSASQSWTGRVRVTFTSDSSAAMKHIEDLSPKFGVEEMEVVDKVNKDQEEGMDQGDQSTEESATMDT